MKLFPPFIIRPGVLALVISLAGGTALRAADENQRPDNIATADNGAYIIYSTPIKGGNSANFLTQDSNHKLSFSNQGSAKLFVLDLGKTYSISTVSLKFTNPVKFEIFVLGNKPGNGDWTAVLGAKPDYISDTASLEAFLRGHQGRYIVFVTDSDPGLFYGLYVTGLYVPHPGDGDFVVLYRPHNGENGYGNGLPETPIPRKYFYPPYHFPSP